MGWQVAASIAGAILVAVVTWVLATRLERERQRSALETQAVIDIGRAFAIGALTRTDAGLLEASVLFADAKVRLAAYGSRAAAMAVSRFIEAGATTTTPASRAAMVAMVQAIRRGGALRRNRLDDQIVDLLLFSVAAPGVSGIPGWDAQFEMVKREIEIGMAVPLPAGAVPLRQEPGDAWAATIDSAFGRIENRLKELLATSLVGRDDTIQGDELVRMALERGVVDAATAHSIGGLMVLRDLAVSAPPDRTVDPNRVADFDALSRAILYTLG